jgi:hypothetical protein
MLDPVILESIRSGGESILILRRERLHIAYSQGQ